MSADSLDREKLVGSNFRVSGLEVPMSVDGSPAAHEKLDKATHLLLEAVELLSGPPGVPQFSPGFNMTSHLERFETCLARLNSSAHRYLANQRRVINDNQHINKLPVEVLVRIFFFFSLHGQVKEGQTQWLHRLAHVCFSWSNIIKQSPQLWGVASSQDTLRTLDLVISKSQNAPLDVRSHDWHVVKPDVFWARVLQHSHRCRSLEVAGGELEQKVIERSYPMLVDLKMTDCTGDPLVSLIKRSVLDIPSDTIKHLRHLHLEKGCFRWDMGALSGLRTLTLAHLYANEGRSTSRLIAALHASPGLVELRLEQLQLDDSSAVEATPLYLNHLVELVLKDLPLPSLLSIITAIRIPICTTLILIAKDGPEDVNWIDASTTQHLHAPIRSILTRIGGCCATLGSQRVELSGNRRWGSVGIHVILPVVSFQNPLDWLDTILDPISPLSPLSLSLELSATAPMRLLTTMPTLVREDALTGPHLLDNRNGAVWVEYLSRPIMRDGMEHWVLRDLSRLEVIMNGVDLSCLMDMVRLRAGDGLEDVEGAETSSKMLPRRLDALRITQLEFISEDDQASLMKFLEKDAELICPHQTFKAHFNPLLNLLSESGSDHEYEQEESVASQELTY